MQKITIKTILLKSFVILRINLQKLYIIYPLLEIIFSLGGDVLIDIERHKNITKFEQFFELFKTFYFLETLP